MPRCVFNSHFRNPSSYKSSSSTVGSECQLPVDIILKSSDGILLGGHKSNLDMYSEGFPPMGSPPPQPGPPEVVDFEETSETLSYLLHFMHKVQYPDLSELKAKRLFALADAAEKWRVLSAMAVCNAHILSNQYAREFFLFPQQN
ncbi:hypothetical protein EST38_g5917 [Candolleomyces aberdarensis]|uniref:BTB domain-containing protein n=1 Tax=Candolleomyces aberdarensis TaxID=2316362 RepID=A0A4Q2DL78_9AGAR|nr:hypothetical protein EST38_g5917 [Candolleomyces aberdarensis]